MDDLLNALTSPQAAVGTGGTVMGLNILGVTLPEMINVLVVIYTVLLIVHKGFQIYSDWKKKK